MPVGGKLTHARHNSALDPDHVRPIAGPTCLLATTSKLPRPRARPFSFGYLAPADQSRKSFPVRLVTPRRSTSKSAPVLPLISARTTIPSAVAAYQTALALAVVPLKRKP